MQSFFESIDHLAPRCEQCDTTLVYGENTTYNEKQKAHLCDNCGFVLK